MPTFTKYFAGAPSLDQPRMSVCESRTRRQIQSGYGMGMGMGIGWYGMVWYAEDGPRQTSDHVVSQQRNC